MSNLISEQLYLGQNEVLEMIARGAPLASTLDRLMRLIESQSDGGYCSVVLLDDDGVTVHPVSGPSLAPEFMASFEGQKIGPAAGSCGTAMYLRQNVIVTDVMNDPLWEPYRGIIAPYGLRACWSTPIYLNKNQVLGSFAMYYREVRAPGEDELRLISVATHLASIAIERTRAERDLANYREHLEEVIAARTRELTAARDQLVRRDKLAALGALVAGVAHELNTPIGNSLMVATTIGEQTRALASHVVHGLRRSMLDHYLAQAEEAAHILTRNLRRAADMVASFQQLALDHTAAQRCSFNLGELVADLMPPLQIVLRQRHVALEVDIPADLTMDSYAGPLAQILTKLFDNCVVHAFESDGGGAIRIAARARGDDWIAIVVADDGIGMSPDVAARVYDPFFTTRPGVGGVGLGLHIVHNTVTGILGGNIELDTAPGRGARFTLTLPRSAPVTLCGA